MTPHTPENNPMIKGIMGIIDLKAELARLTKHLHDQHNFADVGPRRGHPDYEYADSEVGRKTGEDPTTSLEGDGWEENGEGHDSWDRGEFSEIYCFRRLKPELRPDDWVAPDLERYDV